VHTKKVQILGGIVTSKAVLVVIIRKYLFWFNGFCRWIAKL